MFVYFTNVIYRSLFSCLHIFLQFSINFLEFELAFFPADNFFLLLFIPRCLSELADNSFYKKGTLIEKMVLY